MNLFDFMNIPDAGRGLLDSDLAPLPDESMFSMVARLSRANMYTPREAARLARSGDQPLPVPFLSYKRSRYRKRSPLQTTCAQLSKVTGWPEASIYPAELAMLDGYHGVWFDKKLALCPECIAHRYHSHWHQLLGLEHCPWHQVPIERACRCCGTPFDLYTMTPTVLANGYTCRACGIAYHQSALSAETGALWRSPEVIAKAFASHRRWARRAAATLRHYNVWYRWPETSIEQWWSFDEAMRAMVELLAGRPPGCHASAQNVTYLVWPLRSCANFRRGHDMYYDTAWKHHRTLPPYIGALQDLQTWILDTCALPDVALSPQLFRNNAIQIGEWPAAALAYMLLRLTWECPDTWSPAAKIDVRQFSARSQVLPVWDVLYDPRSTRVLTFATFAALYWMIKNSPGPTISNYHASDRVTTAYLGTAGRGHFGAVWFPTIPGVLEDEAKKPGYLNLAH